MANIADNCSNREQYNEDHGTALTAAEFVFQYCPYCHMLVSEEGRYTPWNPRPQKVMTPEGMKLAHNTCRIGAEENGTTL